jgi:tRNA-dihydrouridine synthase 1
MISKLHKYLPIPVTAKIRILDTREATLAYAKNVLDAGASILTVHGRRREQKGHITGLADWKVIRYLRENLPPETVLFANGNVLQHGDLARCLEATGADGVMSAEGNLSDPAIFAQPPGLGQEGREYWRGQDGQGGWRVDAMVRRYLDILHKYVLDAAPPQRRPLFVPGDDTSWLEENVGGIEAEEPSRKKRKTNGGKQTVTTSPNFAATQAHMFHLLRHFVSKHTDVRDILARTRGGDIASLERVLHMIERKVAKGLIEYELTGGESLKGPSQEIPPVDKANDTGAIAEGKEVEADTEDAESSVAAVKRCQRPWWVAQPIVRPLPKEALAKGAIALSKKEKEKLKSAGG